jgi:hypothetical protein
MSLFVLLVTAGDDLMCKQILEASGAQFPVAGVVYEDMDGTGQLVWPFRHGVTVEIEGLPYAQAIQPTPQQMMVASPPSVNLSTSISRPF